MAADGEDEDGEPAYIYLLGDRTGYDTITDFTVNSPTEYGGYWYFQSMWDKPPRNQPTGGMNYTGLGIGNRNGVYTQLLGCCLAVVGMIFAFYVKPIMVRRRAEAAISRRGRALLGRTNGRASSPTQCLVG